MAVDLLQDRERERVTQMEKVINKNDKRPTRVKIIRRNFETGKRMLAMSQSTAPSHSQLTTGNAINIYLVAISSTLWIVCVVLGAKSEIQETPHMGTEAPTSQHHMATSINSPDTFISLMIFPFVSLGRASRTRTYIKFNFITYFGRYFGN